MKKPSRSPKKSTSNANSGAKKTHKIVESILSQVPFDGWTDAALAAGAKAAGVSRKDADSLFPDGIADVIRQFGDMADEAMQNAITHEHGFARMRVREKIGFAVRARLEFLLPYREAMKRLVVWYAIPRHVPMAMKRAPAA